MGKHYKLDLFAGHSVTLYLFTNVTNSEEIHKRLLKGELEYAFLNPEMVRCDVIIIYAIVRL
jgi:hypothetical protein